MAILHRRLLYESPELTKRRARGSPRLVRFADPAARRGRRDDDSGTFTVSKLPAWVPGYIRRYLDAQSHSARAPTRIAGPGPNSPSRRRSRGVLGRFGRLVGRPCPLYKAAYDGIDPGAAGTSGAYRELPSREERAHIVARTWCFDRDSLRRPFPTYRPPPRALCAVIGAALETIVASLVAFGPA